MPEFDPTPAEINQTENVATVPIPPLPVTVVDPIPVRDMPAVSSGWQAYDVPLTTSPAVRVLGRDPRRKRALIVAVDLAGTTGRMQLGGTQAEAGSDRATIWPINTPLEITGSDEVWASARTAVITVSVINEQWAQ